MNSFGLLHSLKDNIFSIRFLARRFQQIRDSQMSMDEIFCVLKVARYTQVQLPGLKALMDCAADLNKKGISGDFVECGVWRGGTAALLCAAANMANRTTWLFDSFEGMPEATEKDHCKKSDQLSLGRRLGRLIPVGTNVAPLGYVKHLLAHKFELDMAKIHLIKGWFQDTLPKTKDQIPAIALLRIDGDFYESTMECLKHLYPKVAPGGIVIIDDYNVFVGCRTAVHEYFKGNLPALQQIPENSGVWFCR